MTGTPQTGTYKIVEGQLKIVGGIAGHDFIALIDPSGHAIKEIDGLATTSGGEIKPIGYLPTDLLKVYEFTSYYYSASVPQAVLLSGDYDTVMGYFSVAESAKNLINSQNLHYPFMGLGKNSNSVASTLIQSMGLYEPNSLIGGAPLLPGKGSVLLTPGQIGSLQSQVISNSASVYNDVKNTVIDPSGNQTVSDTYYVNGSVFGSESIVYNSDGSYTAFDYSSNGSLQDSAFIKSDEGYSWTDQYSANGSLLSYTSYNGATNFGSSNYSGGGFAQDSLPNGVTIGYDAISGLSFALLPDGSKVYLGTTSSAPVLPSGSGVNDTSLDISAVAGAFGSSLGRLLGGSSLFIGTTLGSVISAAALSIGKTLFSIPYSPNPTAAGAAAGEGGTIWTDFGNNLKQFGTNAALGSASSYLAAEFAQSIGLNSLGGQVFSLVTGNILQYVATNATSAAPIALFSERGIQGLGTSLESGLAGFIGTELASLVITPHTTAEATLASLGSALGAYAGASVGTAVAIGAALNGEEFLAAAASPIGLAIGAFVGFILGDLFGSLFGHHKPRIPTASASTVLQIPVARYAVGTETSANGGDLALADAMAKAARDTLNGLIAQITGGKTPSYVSNVTSPTQIYGISGNQLYITLGGTQNNVTSADQAVDKGVLWALPQTQIIGGDIILKRSVANGVYSTVTAMLGDLQIASDFETYLKDKPVIDAAISSSWNSLSAADQAFYTANKAFMTRAISASELPLTGTDVTFYNANKAQVDRIVGSISVSSFAAGWIVTLARAAELKLDSFGPSDFYGGLQGFLQSFGVASTETAVHYEDASVGMSNGTLTVSLAGSAAPGTFSLLPTASANGSSIAIANFSTVIGYTLSSAAVTNGNDFVVGTSIGPGQAAINLGQYGYVPATNGGSDIFIGTAAADTLSAGVGDAWINGSAGDDHINGGAGRDVLIGGDGNDTVAAGTGVTYLSGGAGNDSLTGGSGDDVFVGGDGLDTMSGGAGNDTFVIDQDNGAQRDTIDGGAGSNTASFERFNTGVNITVNGSAGLIMYGDSYTNIQNLTGTNYSDILYGLTGSGSTIRGLAGNDTLYGGSGNDTLEGGAGADILWGGYGTDTASYANSSAGVFVSLDTADVKFDAAYYLKMNPDVAAAGADPLTHFNQWGWKEHRNPNAYFNTAYYLNANPDIAAAGVNPFTHYQTNGVSEGRHPAATLLDATLAIGGDATGDQLYGIENVTGSAYGDELVGNAGVNVIQGNAGDDWIDASAGADSYQGGDGFDTVDYSQTQFVSGTGTAYLPPNNTPYTTTIAAVAVSLSAGTVTVRNADGSTATQGLNSIEQVIGTAGIDSFSSSGTSLNVTWDGDGGADSFAGGAGSDTYAFGRNYSTITITDSNAAANTVSMKSGITFDDLYAYNNNGALVIGIRGQAGYVSVASDFATAGNDIVKTLDLAGAAQVDLTQLGGGNLLTDNADTFNGSANLGSITFGYGGNDTINTTGGALSTKGSIVAGGLGNDTITTSSGDDQFLFERGDGHDIVTDGGGQNTIVFGPTVGADDVIYQVVGNDLYVGIKDLTNGSLTASQVADNIKLVGGGVEYVGITNPANHYWSANFSVEAGGATTDLTKANVAWTTQPYWDGGSIPPIVLDLNGDGLEITPVAESDIATQDVQGNILRTSWVGPTNGILAFDRNGDGQINNTSDISFLQDKDGATTDLQGLAGWDTNADGLLSSQDANWGKLVVWVDANQDGRAENSEVKTLDQLGIASIDLQGQPTGFDGTDTIDTVVRNTTTFTRTDGTAGTGYDVALARQLLSGPVATPDAASIDPTAVATIGQLTSDPLAAGATSTTAMTMARTSTSTTARTEHSLSMLAGADFSSRGGTMSATDAARWADYIDPVRRAARRQRDAAGGIGDQNLEQIRSTTAYPNGSDPLTGRGTNAAKVRLQSVVINLSGNGLKLIDPKKSHAVADVMHTGGLDEIGWIKPAEGLLAYDRNADGLVDIASETDFRADLPNAKTSLQGLAAFDTNNDGVLSAADSSFARFLIWRDLNGNGISDAGEVQTLDQAGVARISLAATNLKPDRSDIATNDTLAQTSVTLTSGATRSAYDVAFGYANAGSGTSTSPTASAVPNASAALASTGSNPTPVASGAALQPSDTLNSASSNGGAMSMAVESSRSGEDGPTGDVVESATIGSLDASGWWQQAGPVTSEAKAQNMVPRLDPGAHTTADTPSIASPVADAATLQRRQLLRQAMAAFQGGGSGGSAAIWNRQGIAHSDAFVAGLPAAAVPRVQAATLAA